MSNNQSPGESVRIKRQAAIISRSDNSPNEKGLEGKLAAVMAVKGKTSKMKTANHTRKRCGLPGD
ncbi:hypothetical protein K7H94_02750 [Pantoea dispersa]|uniref:hypothetical protein n=1 Tax=Pantoea dispersa TaxID=59814 RepID=UPI001CA7A06B|nr:hypothetical protein [Pantoea dispersa]QZY90884.1 hypothetical protein K7H94_02750 [Pantoea dispersa]